MNHIEREEHTLKYPGMREELLDYLRTLADVEFQRRAWVRHELPPGVENCFDFAVHFIFDDAKLAEDHSGAIGLFIKDEDEVRLIEAVVHALEQVFNALGMEATDEEYIDCPEWAGVLESASRAWQVMKDDI